MSKLDNILEKLVADEELRQKILMWLPLTDIFDDDWRNRTADGILALFRTAEAEAYHRGQIDELNRLQVDRQGKILSSDVSQRLAELATSANDTMTDHSQDAAMANDTSAQDDGGKE